MKLPITLKNKLRNTNLKFDFLKVPLWTPKKVRFWFLKKDKKILCVSALIQL